MIIALATMHPYELLSWGFVLGVGASEAFSYLVGLVRALRG